MKIFWTKEKAWSVDVTIAGKRIRESEFATKKATEEFVTELRMQAKRARHGLERDRARVTVAELVAEHGEDIDQSRSRGRQMKKILASFLASLPEGLTIDELRAAHIRAWLKWIKPRGLGRGPLSPASCNRYLAEVSVMLKAAPSWFEEIGEDWRPPRIPWQRESRRGRERVISAEERTELLEALRFPKERKDGKGLKPSDIASRRDVADCFELALLTGMRGVEVRSLEWSEVDLAEAEINLPAHKTKTREPRVVLLNERAVEILQRRKNYKYSNDRKGKNVSQISRRLSRFIFPNERGDGPRKEISRVIRPLARELGLRYGANVPDGFTPHSTRHTATTEMLRRGHDLKTVQDVVGHSDKVMSLRYAHSTRQSRRSAVESLSADTKKRG